MTRSTQKTFAATQAQTTSYPVGCSWNGGFDSAHNPSGAGCWRCGEDCRPQRYCPADAAATATARNNALLACKAAPQAPVCGGDCSGSAYGGACAEPTITSSFQRAGNIATYSYIWCSYTATTTRTITESCSESSPAATRLPRNAS